MRISSGILAAAVVGVVAAAASAQQQGRYDSPQVAFEQGLGAYQAGDEAMAIPALTEAAAKGNPSARFYAEFYLARLYSETAGAVANRTKAYMLFRKLADENLGVDPDDTQRAPFVAKALIALAGYARAGVKEIDLAPNPRRAADYLNHAATVFGDKEAQFELARTYLSGDAAGDDVKRGLHYLVTLTKESYPTAQALLADLLWRGRHVKKDDERALALITMAVENAPAHERMWIEETYHNIYCATAQGTRQEADGIVARWRRMFARPPAEPADRLGGRELLPDRQCANGESIAVRRAGKTGAVAAAPPAAPAQAEVIKGSAVSLGFRAAEPAAKK